MIVSLGITCARVSLSGLHLLARKSASVILKHLAGVIPAGADTLLGPEMRSTGEVMGIDKTFAKAYAKAAIAAGQKLPTKGNVFITMIDKHKADVVPIAKELQACPLTSLIFHAPATIPDSM